jgi:serine/threonine protein kinase
MMQLTGKNLKHYTIEKLISEGGMGKVFKARDTVLERNVAIKILSDHLLSNEENIKRFYQEARAAARLNHDNIVTIYEFGEDDGHYFIVMELIEGQTIGRLVRKKVKLRMKSCLKIIYQALTALDFAHKNGVLHRDIKSDNIMVTTRGKVKVLDFGIAKIGEDLVHTKMGNILGTVEYISPEQIKGENVDEGSDLYSLGIVLFEILFGRLPFTGESPVAVAYAHLNTPVPIPDASESHIPERLKGFLLKMLAKESGNRYLNAGEALKDIDCLLKDTDKYLTLSVAGEDSARPGKSHADTGRDPTGKSVQVSPEERTKEHLESYSPLPAAEDDAQAPLSNILTEFPSKINLNLPEISDSREVRISTKRFLSILISCALSLMLIGIVGKCMNTDVTLPDGMQPFVYFWGKIATKVEEKRIDELRDRLWIYFIDRGEFPEEIQELVTAGYAERGKLWFGKKKTLHYDKFKPGERGYPGYSLYVLKRTR